MKLNKRKIAIVAIIILILCGLFVLYIRNLNKDKDILDDYTKLFISPKCIYCQEQKEILGKAINNIKVINCLEEPEVCRKENITGVPTWKKDNGEVYVGVRRYTT